MPLYSNVLLSGSDEPDPSAKDEKTAPQLAVPPKAPPSASMKLLQDHLISKKRAKQSSFHAQKLQRLASKPSEASPRIAGFDWNPNEEYDPMAPNSYEILQLEQIKAEESKRNAMKNSVAKIDPNILDVLERLESEESETKTESRSNRGTAIAPPPTLQVAKQGTPSGDLNTPKAPQQQAAPSEKLDGSSAAAKIMAKMGYKTGQGLGKDEQGMNAPLEVELSGPSAGRIVQRTRTPPPQPPPAPDQGPQPVAECTRVLLLQNMVGPGEVDDELEAETKMECTKYGEVVKCLIYEIPNKLVPDDEAVRIFVEFKETSSAKKAANDLNGRYFGGRVVKAAFYDVDRFSRYDLNS